MNKNTSVTEGSSEKLFQKRIAVISLVGDIGKSTIANDLLCPRMPGATMIRVETINSSGKSGAKLELRYRGDQLGEVKVAATKSASSIIDVGTSNVEAFILRINDDFGSHQFFDYFLVPVLAKNREKETKDAIKTLNALRDMGVEPARIKVIFNQLPKTSALEDECEVILNFHRSDPFFTLSRKAVIHESEAFVALNDVGKSYLEMVGDDTNYYQELNAIPMENEEARVRTIKLARAQGTVKKLEMEMSDTFAALFGG